LASIIGIASEDSALAPVIGVLLCLVFLHLFSKRPFKDDDDSSLGIILTYSLSFIFLSALLIKVNAQPQGDLEEQLFGVLLVLLLIVGPGIVVMDMFWSFLSSRIQKRNERRKLRRSSFDDLEVRKPVRKNSLVFVRETASSRASFKGTNGTDADCKDSMGDLPEVLLADATLSRDHLNAAAPAKNIDATLVEEGENKLPFHGISSKSASVASKSEALDSLFEVIDLDGDGELIKSEVVAAAGLLGMTEEEAASLFDDMDENESGKLTRAQFSANKVVDKLSVGLNTIAESISSSLSTSSALMKFGGEANLNMTKKKITTKLFGDLFYFVDEDMQGSRLHAEVSENSSVLSDVPKPSEIPQVSGIASRVNSAANTKPFVTKTLKNLTLEELFTKIDLSGDGELDRSKVVAAADLLEMSAEEAGNLFDKMDIDGSGLLTRSEFGATEFAENVSAHLTDPASDVSDLFGTSTLRDSILARNKRLDQVSSDSTNSNSGTEDYLENDVGIKRISKVSSSKKVKSMSRSLSINSKKIGTSI